MVRVGIGRAQGFHLIRSDTPVGSVAGVAEVGAGGGLWGVLQLGDAGRAIDQYISE